MGNSMKNWVITGKEKNAEKTIIEIIKPLVNNENISVVPTGI